MKDIIKNQDKSIEYFMSKCQELESKNYEFKTIKQQLLDDFYYTYSKNLELQERVKELEEKSEMILNVNKNLFDKINSLTKDDTLNVRTLKSELDIDFEQLEIMFRFLPENKYFESEFQLIFDFFPTDIQKEKYKDLKHKLYKILVDNHP